MGPEPGEFSSASDAKYNKCQNEKTYVDTFAPLLKSAGMPNHAIIDTGRNAVSGLRKEWGDWCNVNGAGFGVRPTGDTGDDLADAFVWIKPGGESDGTSDSSANRYDSFCGKSDAYKPAPEAVPGTRPTSRCWSRTPCRPSKRRRPHGQARRDMERKGKAVFCFRGRGDIIRW